MATPVSPKMRMTQVTRVEDLSPHMRRIVLKSDELADFPTGQESAHVKIILPKPGQSMPKLGFSLDMKKRMRSYTVRYFDAQTQELTLDFAVNDHKGLAASWASNAQPGDYLGIAGPGPTKHTNYDADWHLIVGDLTALPAIAATLEKLPSEAIGYCVIQVPSELDIQDLKLPDGIELKWLINTDHQKNALLEYVETLNWQDGEPAIFIASEVRQMKAIRTLVKGKPGYQASNTYASGYWKA